MIGKSPQAAAIRIHEQEEAAVRDIREHFRSRLEVDLLLLDGGAVRTNLTFEVLPTSRSTKLADILDTIERALPSEGASGAIVYCATRAATERVAGFLHEQGLSADFFHAGLPPDRKREVQERFQSGDLRIIAATNAFGMGIDKPDIRLVVHGDIPGSLENYLQEAGRAGRDREQATCILLFNSEDVERQFNLSARSRLARHEIGAILKALRRLDTRARRNGEVVATPGEIVREERDREFERDSATDDTRVKTAVAWLEEATLASREENRVQIFPSSLRVRTMEEAAAILARAEITETRRKQLLSLVQHMMNAPRDAGVTTDELAGASGLAGPALRKALADLEALGIANDDTAITVFVHLGVEGASAQRFQAASRLEAALIAAMREAAPDAEDGQTRPLHLAATCQTLRDQGHDQVRPDLIERHLRSMAQDGRDEAGGRGNLHLRKAGRNTCDIRLQRSWDTLARTAELRRNGAELLLRHLEGLVPKGTRGKDIQVETTMGKLHAALAGDALLKGSVNDLTRLLDRALLWLHEQGVATLGRGLTIFRSAITVHLTPGGRQFMQSDFLPLEEHYAEQTVQTHIMAAYAERGLESIVQAERLSQDYFTLDRDTFLGRWLPGRGTELRRQTTSASWKAIVDDLGNTTQARIVSDDREQVNVLVLAGPGSGKTRVLVHRIAYLIRVRREDPRGILVLTYNRHAAVEIRERLKALIGDDAAGVTVSTCHALAMRLVGASFAGRLDTDETRDFDRIVADAAALLRGDGLPKVEAEAMRDTLIEGYRWILVDEYQDIGREEYALIAAVAGRSLDDPDLRLSLFAVGDDDQNIYAFKGASVEFIRRFEVDYSARPAFLTENYRSTHNIIEAAMDLVFQAYADMWLTENHIRQLHQTLLRHSTKDERHRGAYKTLPNNVVAFDADGHEIGVVFETATPFDTPREMEALVAWARKAIEEEALHPLLVVAVFVVVFLAIHPFQDGNGRLSRILTTLLLLRAGYAYVPYASLERVIEENKDLYYKALRRTQTTLGDDAPDWEPWIGFFLRCLKKQKDGLAVRLDRERVTPAGEEELPTLAIQIIKALRERERLSIAELADITGANRNTMKVRLRELVAAGRIRQHGKARATWYSL